MRSAIEVTDAQLPAEAPHVSGVASRTTATLPPDTAMLVVPIVSGVGSAAPIAAAEASCTRCRRPGAIDPVNAVTCQVAPDADAYWIVHPPTSTAVDPRLKSSTKSFANGAPELPPPGKTWLTTMSGDALRAAGTASTPPATRTMRRTRATTRDMPAPIDEENRTPSLIPRCQIGRKGAWRIGTQPAQIRRLVVTATGESRTKRALSARAA